MSDRAKEKRFVISGKERLDVGLHEDEFLLQAVFYCGAMSPVEGSKSPRQINHPLCGCASKVKPIDPHFATMRVFKPQSRKESLWLTKVIALHIRNGCANTI